MPACLSMFICETDGKDLILLVNHYNMRKIYFFFLFALTIFSSCRKEKEGNAHPPDNVVTHYAYVKGFVIDSLSGLPVSHAGVFATDGKILYDDFMTPYDSTKTSGSYTVRVYWYTGTAYEGTVTLERPGPTTVLYIDGFSSNKYGYVKINWGALTENDTIVVPNILVNKVGYISTHVKDVSTPANYLHLSWEYVIGNKQEEYFPANSDTTVIWKVYPNVKTRYVWTVGDSVIVGSGDTTYLNLYY